MLELPAAPGTVSPRGDAAQPLVSVIVRSMRRASLREALESVDKQTYSNIEVVLVNAAGGEHEVVAGLGDGRALRWVNQGGAALDRAAAANGGLAAARGDWLLFLDDDDVLHPDHVARLREALARSSDSLVAYSGVEVVDDQGRVVHTYDEDFDAPRLWLANYLPIHAVLFSRRFVDEGHRFDESLPVYEDWDFWRSLSLRQRFLHVAGVSASYRTGGDSGVAGQSVTPARERFYRKWLPRLDAAALEQMAANAERDRGRLAEHEKALAASAAELAQVRSHAEQLEHEVLPALNDQLARARAEANGLGASLARANAQVGSQKLEIDATRGRAAALERQIEEGAAYVRNLEAQLDRARAEYGRLEAEYLRMRASLSWRVTAPLRWLRARAGFARPAARALARMLPASWRRSLKLRLASGRAGARVLRWLGAAAPAATVVKVPAPAVLDKEAVRASAEEELSGFLASGERIELRRAGAAPQITVVVVVFNQAGLTLACLRALAASQGVTFETLIVDNASSDRMPELLARTDGVTVMRQAKNVGFLRAVNLAAEHARGQYLLLLNNDAVVEPRTLANAARRLDRDQGIAAVGGAILLWDGRLQEAGSIIWSDGSCLGYGRGDSPEAPEYRFVREVDYCSGALLMLRRERFEALGRFDEAFAPAYYEESDLCVRLWERGHRIVYDPRVRVRHFEFASEGASGGAIELQQRNRGRFVERHRDFLAQQLDPGLPDLLRARQRLGPGALRVLMVDDRVPLRWLGQGYPRAADMAEAVARAGHFVTHYPLQFPHESEADVAAALPETVEVMLGRGVAGFADFIAGRAGYYDALIVSRPHNMELLRALRATRPGLLAHTRLIYDAEALFSLREIAKAQVMGEALPAEEQRRRIRAEVALARGADAVITVSALEARHFRAAGYDPVHVLGHALDLRPGTAGHAERRGFLFVGALTADDTPNADSLLWFLGRAWPKIVDALGDGAVLDIVGLCEAPAVKAYAGPAVRLHGSIDSLDEVFDRARVFVVPTRYAAGIAHKAHLAAARGLPMVLSPLIAEQLGWSATAPVGASAAEFAQECLRLHGDAGHWARTREKLIAAVREDCDPRRFDETLRGLLAPRREGRG
jgi:GT2 family glycosyltransferase